MLSKRHLWCTVVLAMNLSAVPAQSETIQVIIENIAFSPAEINVKVGDTIEWINKDILAHTATVEGGWDVMIPPKETAIMVVRTVESVDYYCRFHPNMKGHITAAP